jgi:uncharacterized protein YdhG (YjbR/CyaY superfamily)
MAKVDASRHAPDEIDAYLAPLSEAERAALERVRMIVRETAPDRTERVSYGIPIFRLNKDLVGMSAAKNHLSLHVMNPPFLKSMADELAGIKVSGATIHFMAEKPLPEDLWVRIVRARVEELGFS